MVDISHSSWTERDADNNSPSPNGIQTGFAPTTVGPILQATRGAIKRERNRINAFYTTTGTATALALTLQVAPDSLVKGDRYAFFASQTNTGAMTLGVNGLGAKAILQQDGSALKAGQIVSGSATAVIYDGTAFRLENYVSNPKFSGTLSADTISAATITGTLAGNGAAITAINASNIATGTIADTRLPATMSGKSFTTDVSINQTLSVGTTNGGGIEIGRTNGTASPAFIDFHTSATAVDYNVRLNATGDTANAGGTLDILSASLKHNGAEVWDTASLPTPAVQATQIVAGNGLTGGGTLAASRTITLGAPGTITNSTTNTVTDSGHTHALTLVASDVTGALGFTPPSNTVSIGVSGIATGGGNLTANRTINVPKSTNAQALAGTDDTTAMTPLRTKEAIAASVMPGLGIDQTWQRPTRSVSVTYQNTTGKPIMVIAYWSEANQIDRPFQISTDNVNWTRLWGANAWCFLIIPDGSYYRILGPTNLQSWMELR